jgi:hypothetical protein
MYTRVENIIGFKAIAGRAFKLCEVRCPKKIGFSGEHFAKIQILLDYILNSLDYREAFLAEIAPFKD